MSTLEESDRAAEAVRKGFRITLDDLQLRIVDEDYAVHDTLTVCVLTLDTGWHEVGTSAAVDPANFDADLGRRLARDDAVRKLWPLLAFAWLEDQRGVDAGS